MKAFAQAVMLYRGDTDRLRDDISSLISVGYVYAEPDSILAGFRCRSEEVCWKMRTGGVMMPHCYDPDGDTWFVWLAVGRAAEMPCKAPFPLKYLAYARRGVLRLHRFAEITRRVTNQPEHTMAKKGKGKGGKKC